MQESLPLSLNAPAGQLWQAVAEVLPELGLKRPAAQPRQAAGGLAKKPAGHTASQAEAPALLKAPSAQGRQPELDTLAAEAPNVPAGQGVGLRAFSVQKKPAGQGVGLRAS